MSAFKRDIIETQKQKREDKSINIKNTSGNGNDAHNSIVSLLRASLQAGKAKTERSDVSIFKPSNNKDTNVALFKNTDKSNTVGTKSHVEEVVHKDEKSNVVLPKPKLTPAMKATKRILSLARKRYASRIKLRTQTKQVPVRKLTLLGKKNNKTVDRGLLLSDRQIVGVRNESFKMPVLEVMSKSKPISVRVALKQKLNSERLYKLELEKKHKHFSFKEPKLGRKQRKEQIGTTPVVSLEKIRQRKVQMSKRVFALANPVSKFYWKYLHGDIVVSKFINFLIKDGKKNRALSILFKSLFNLKQKFGLNPILILKYAILKRNSIVRVNSKQVKGKPFFTFRILDYKKQINLTIKKIMRLVTFFKKKNNLKLWQSLFLILLNFSLNRNADKASLSLDRKLNIEKKKHSFLVLLSSYRRTKNLITRYIKTVNSFTRIWGGIALHRKLSYLLLSNRSTSSLSQSLVGGSYSSNIIGSYKLYSTYFKLKQLIIRNLEMFTLDLIPRLVKLKTSLFAYKKALTLKLSSRAGRKKLLLSKISEDPTRALEIIRAKNRSSFLTRGPIKDVSELEQMKKLKYSVINFKKQYRLKKEIDMGKRMHLLYDERLRRRVVFFRVSTQGQKNNI